MGDDGSFLDRMDRFGGRVIGRFWGTILLAAVLLIAVPIAIASALDGDWLGASISLGAAALGGAAVRYLFSGRRRLSDYE